MIERGIARRYIRALFDLAVEAEVAGEVRNDLDTFEQLLQENDELKSFLWDPRVAVSEKKETLAKVLPDSFQDLSQDFLLLVVERGRASLLEVAADEYGQLLREREGVERVHVTSATELSETQESELRSKLGKATGRRIDLVTAVDKDLIGGLRIRIGSSLWDGSLRRGLEDLRTRLQGTAMPIPEPLTLTLSDGEADQDADD